jgi:hypothetical protein
MFIPDGVLVMNLECKILLHNYAILSLLEVKTKAELQSALNELAYNDTPLLDYLK